MTRSMTAFARAENGAAVWEIRSVNHRYLDVSFRMQENLRHLESTLRNAFKTSVQRGKLECVLKIKSETLNTSLSVNKDLIKQLTSAIEQVGELSGLKDKGDLLSLMRWPDVLTPVEDTDNLTTDIQKAFDEALSQLVDMREREGAELSALIATRLADAESTINELRDTAPTVALAQQERLKKRLDDLDIEVDPGRLEQELVIQTQKLDVMEELDRLDTHIAEVRRSLDSIEPVGRRLDFLMQELNREANTLSSKAQSSETTLHAVDLKVLIEQMREQVQNIE
ncbi:MAG: YicC family protein [Gammaproteobacteria bacterium]|jgi:uncharacterized protein (TIGR00255 family)|nr:YicC family protein [Gammaproteobacteria bacterium]MBT4494671.1 YicC family protein [Gammaproteobacteria bacterium]MBT7370919.1 YicC family protein [Gammaproteobacteria bacterium]